VNEPHGSACLVAEDGHKHVGIVKQWIHLSIIPATRRLL